MLNIPEAVKEQFKKDGVLKNIRIVFPNGEYNDISNDRLIKESLKFDESISSREYIQFGLCEASQISFECVDIDDIKGLEIEVFVEIDVTDEAVPHDISPDVPFPFYSVPLGKFIVDEAKLDAKMQTRKVTAYSRISDLPNYDWWTNLHTIFYSNYPLNFNVMNFIVATNNKIFDTTDFESTPISSGWVKLNTISPFDGGSRFLAATDTFESENGKKYFIEYQIGESYAYYNQLYSDQYLKVPNTNRLGRLDKYTLSNNYEISRNNSIDTINRTISNADDLIDYVLNMLDFIGLPNPIMMYRYAGWGDAGISYIGKTLFVGDMFLLPPKLIIPGTASATIYEVTSGGNVYKCGVGLAFIDDMTNVNISEITTGFENWTIPIYADYIEETSYALDATFAKKILSFDMRKYLESYVELHGCFGHINRYGYFDMIELAEVTLDGLFPANDIYPSNDLYPKEYGLVIVDTDKQEIIENESSIDLWFEKKIIGFGRLVCEYTSSEVLDEDNNPAQVIHQVSWDDDERMATYDVSDNEFIKSGVWTKAQIEALLAPLITALQKIMYYPAEVSMVGLPYIEAGDELFVNCHNHQLLVLNLSRTLDGIQAMRDKVKTD